jgi:4-amino-4-deoxy-L-arabinose transferase-like glycosyltransferase
MFKTPARLLAVLALWLTSLALWRPFAVPDEGRYTDVARWMLRSGDWVVPRLNGLPFLHKPPLYYWIEAVSMGLLGPHALAARLASVLGALLICAVAYTLVRRAVDEPSARWTAVLLATNPLLVLGSQYANLDMLVAGCIAATVALAAIASQAPPAQRRWWWMGTYALAALGVLAKGLIGIVLPGAVFVLWALLERQPRRVWEGLSVAGLAVMAVIAVPWFWMTEQRVPGFWHFFFTVQHFERYTEAGFNNAHGAWFYPAIVIIGMLPWSLLAWPAVRSSWQGQGPARSLTWLAIAWFAVVMVFFSLPPSKLVGYIFPLMPAVAILLGPWVARWRYRMHLAVLGALVCAVLVGVATVKQNDQATSLARALKAQIAPADQVVFWERYHYAVPVALDRSTPAWVVSDWSVDSRHLPDNWRRELMEGREFAPRSSQPLMTRAQWVEQLQSHPGTTHWIWADRQTASTDPLLKTWPVVQSAGPVVVLKAVMAASPPAIKP